MSSVQLKNTSHPNGVFIEKLLSITGIKNDRRLAAAIGIGHPALCNMRAGRLRIGYSHIVRFHDLTGMRTKEIKEIMASSGVVL